MKFLLDENQSPVLVDLIVAAGHDVVHARDTGLKSAPDSTVLETAAETGRVLISGDTDFGELLAASNASSPSVVLFRRQGQRRAGQIAALLLMNLATVEADLEAGAVVVFDNDRIRVRTLPMQS